MNKEIFFEKYRKLNVTEEEIVKYVDTIINFEKFVKKDIKDTNIEDIKKYFKHLINTNYNTYGNVIHFARYYNYIDMKTEYIHMTKYFNSLGVLENIIHRVSLFDTKEKQDDIMREMILPPFGLSSEELPEYTKDFMDKLNKHLPKAKCNKILAGNNHKIPSSSFDKEKEFYKESKSFEEYLKARHQRKVDELSFHLENNLVWFEQIITEESIDFVRRNQEVLSGVIKDNKLYVTKIPYDLENYLHSEDDVLKRYYACHCTFVRENILLNKVNIPKEWCYCSAGFAKFPFENILEQELNIKLLESPIDGDYICRFEIDLEGIEYKK